MIRILTKVTIILIAIAIFTPTAFARIAPRIDKGATVTNNETMVVKAKKLLEKKLKAKKKKEMAKKKKVEEQSLGANAESQDPRTLTVEVLDKPADTDIVVGRQIQVGVLITNTNGEYVRDSKVSMTAPDEKQNKTKKYANVKNGFQDPRWFYKFAYTPETKGEHVLKFNSMGLTGSITIIAR